MGDREATNGKGGSRWRSPRLSLASPWPTTARRSPGYLLGRPADFHPNETEAVWQLTETGWIYVVGDGNRAGTALLTLIVDDLESHLADLAGRGLATGAIETVAEVMRKAVITDPEGNMITFAEDLSKD